MVEALWYHALRVLDFLRTGDPNGHISEFYQFADQTGILETHKHYLAQAYLDKQVDVHTMYDELINMIESYERENSTDQQQYDSTKSVDKIEGYQGLTNKLQRFLNQRFILDIEELNKKHAEKNETVDDHITKHLSFLQKNVELITFDNQDLRTTNSMLEHEIDKLKGQFLQIEEKIESVLDNDKPLVQSYNESAISFLFQKLDAQSEVIEKMNDKIQEIETETNTHANNIPNMETICSLEQKNSELSKRLSDLESSDLYLQELHLMMMKRINLVEKNFKKFQKKFSSINNEEEGLGYDLSKMHKELKNQVQILERSILDLQIDKKNMEVAEEENKKKKKTELMKHKKRKSKVQRQVVFKEEPSHYISERNLLEEGYHKENCFENTEIVNEKSLNDSSWISSDELNLENTNEKYNEYDTDDSDYETRSDESVLEYFPMEEENKKFEMDQVKDGIYEKSEQPNQFLQSHHEEIGTRKVHFGSNSIYSSNGNQRSTTLYEDDRRNEDNSGAEQEYSSKGLQSADSSYSHLRNVNTNIIDYNQDTDISYSGHQMGSRNYKEYSFPDCRVPVSKEKEMECTRDDKVEKYDYKKILDTGYLKKYKFFDEAREKEFIEKNDDIRIEADKKERDSHYAGHIYEKITHNNDQVDLTFDQNYSFNQYQSKENKPFARKLCSRKLFAHDSQYDQENLENRNLLFNKKSAEGNSNKTTVPTWKIPIGINKSNDVCSSKYPSVKYRTRVDLK